ncbi:hypothetical protein AVEN_159129-1 [Araneus ventricosus]|uniref:Uncharacterized protein n=1 Tax=Araneus ventricosus TaxID=182803 RepID=A0A4Y2B824_ARAVE|nr:hypothetical protein AVEN_159129-1 [Araneus ventricosus]
MEQVFSIGTGQLHDYIPTSWCLIPVKSTPLGTVFRHHCYYDWRVVENSILANGRSHRTGYLRYCEIQKNRISFDFRISKKMFRMIFIDESQRDLLRIVLERNR